MNIEKLIRKQDFYSDRSGTDFRDGFLLGNGDLCAVGYVPSHLEWVFNKVDVFDPTTEGAMVKKIQPAPVGRKILFADQFFNIHFSNTTMTYPWISGSVTLQ